MLSDYGHAPFLITISIALIHIVVFNFSSWLKRLAFLISSLVLIPSLGAAIEQQIVVALGAIVLASIEKSSVAMLLRKFTLVAVAASGNWINPDLPELIMLLLLIVLQLRPLELKRMATSIISLWSLSFVLIVVTKAQNFENSFVVMVSCLTLLASTLALLWMEYKKVFSIQIVTIVLSILTTRYFIEYRMTQLDLPDLSTLTFGFYLFFAATLVSVIIRGIRNEKSHYYMIATFALALLQGVH